MVVSLKSREGRPDVVAMGQAAIADEITLEVPSSIESLGELVGILKELLAQTSLTTREAKDFHQAVVEMVANSIEWGHRKRAELCVEITYRVRPDAVTVRVRDHGPGFDLGPLNKLDRAKSPEEECAILKAHEEWQEKIGWGHGFGIMLARGLTDNLFYNDAGNEVTLVKRFSSSS